MSVGVILNIILSVVMQGIDIYSLRKGNIGTE